MSPTIHGSASSLAACHEPVRTGAAGELARRLLAQGWPSVRQGYSGCRGWGRELRTSGRENRQRVVPFSRGDYDLVVRTSPDPKSVGAGPRGSTGEHTAA